MESTDRSAPPYVRITVFLLLLLGFSISSWAQSNTSVVDGEVRDPSGAIMQDCQVTLTNLATGANLNTHTNEHGIYLFPSVSAGSYTLEIVRPGFKPYIISNFRVTVGLHTTENAVMEVGSASESITIEANGSAPLLEPNSNEVGTLIESVAVQELPLNGRNFLQLGYLSGAAQNGGTSTSNFLSVQTGHADRDISIAGTEQDMVAFTVNGIAIAGSRLGQAAVNVSISAIDQFKVVQGFFLPSVGTAQGVVNVATKSGSNTWHGEAFEFVRNNSFDARNFFEKQSQPGPFRRNQFGGSLGGPIKKDKLFVFGYYEALRQVRSDPMSAFAPTQAMFDGDFSKLPATIYDPATFDASTGRRQAFAGNIIPSSRINSMSKKLLAYYQPGSDYNTRPANVFGQPIKTENMDQFGVRVDVNLGRHTLFTEYIRENSPIVNGGLFPVSGYSYLLHSQMAMVQLASVVDPHTVNEFRIGWTRPYMFYTGERQDGLQQQLGFTGTADTTGPPGVTLNGFGSFGRSQGLIGNIDNTYQMYDSLNYLHHEHEFRFGLGMRYVRTVQESANFNSRGSMVFSNIFTAQMAPGTGGQLTPVAGTGSSFADFLLGMPVSGTVTSMPRTHYRWTEWEPFFQDTWRLRPGLTLNLGLSWYMATPPNPSGNDKEYPHAFNFQTGKVIFATLGQMDTRVYETDWNNWAPRAGLAWQPSFDKQLVLRAGAGVYYSPQRALYQLFSITAPGVSIVQSIANSPNNPQPTYVLGQNVFPPIKQVPITEEFANNLTGTVFALDQGRRSTYSQQWTFSIQRSLGKSNLIELAYIGSLSQKLPIRWNSNDCSIPGSLLCSSSAIPFKQYSYVFFAANAGFGSYNALTAKFQRQFTNGFAFLTNYTWSKALSNTMQGGANSPLNQMASCRDCDKGMAGFNIPQKLVVNTVYELPLGSGKKFLGGASPFLNQFVKGWTVNAIAVFSKGNPFTVNAPNNTAAVLTNFRANRVCDGRAGMANTNLRSNGLYWLDSGCFATPPAGNFGNSGAFILTGPGVNNWDLGIEKNFRLREVMRLQFRVEAFNAWNHAQFFNPSSMVGDADFGRVSQARAAREIQLGLKLFF